MNNNKNIEDIIYERNIQCLFHFTRVENLKSILEKGLVPRAEIDADSAIVNDEYRYDNCENANCLSVEFPNYKMFWSLRCEDMNAEWVILEIDVNVIKEYQCAFCYCNAGSEEMYSIPLGDRMTAEAFEGIFAERSGYPTRKKLDIPDYYPTNPQAEILVFGTISCEYIKSIIFNNKDTMKKYEKIIPADIEVVVDNDWFYPREDYKHWQKIEV